MFFLQTPRQPGAPQQKPKRLRLLADVSGSMYRFNGVDGRLERSMEAVCMVMEALESYEHKFKVRICFVLASLTFDLDIFSRGWKKKFLLNNG